MAETIYNKNIPLRENKPFLGVLGSILAIIGLFATFALVVRNGNVLYWLFLTGTIMIIGILIVAWVFGSINEYAY